MKAKVTFIFVIFLIKLINCGVVIDPEHKQLFDKLAQDCMEETGATEDDLNDLLHDLLSSTRAGKCLKSCLMVKYSSMNPDGTMNKKVSMEIAKILSKNDPQIMKIAEMVLDACIDLKVSEDKCEATEQYAECLIRNGKEMGLEELVF